MTTLFVLKKQKSSPGNNWATFLIRRVGRLLISLAVLLTIAFLMIHLIPGDPARLSVGLSAPAELVESRREELGLNLPIWQQYFEFWRGILTGDFGDSITQRLPV